ncbi:MAG TPA: ABC transporter permease [Myxococcaceae bacterium]|nr:ABC transporter permease [Myxococcaceae bacterium]
MFGQIATVLRTELKMHFRDRRSLSSAMSLPILGPVMFAAMMIAMAGWLNADDPLKVPVIGAQHAPGLMEHLERAGVIIEAPPEDPEAVIASDDAHVVLVIPEDYPESFTKGEPAHLQLIHDSSKNASRVPVRRLERHLEAYAGQIAAQRLILRGVSPSLVRTVVVDDYDLATPQKLAGQLLQMMVVFLVMAAFVAAVPVATDTMAGERERGSLEALLLNPVDRRALVIGKWLSITVMAFLSVVLMVVAFIVALRFVPMHELGVRVVFGPVQALQALAILLPLVFLAAAAELLISTFARSYKEAQTYLSLATIVPVLPSFIFTFRPVDSKLWMSAVPAMAQDRALSAIIRGEGFDLAANALAFGACGLLAAVCLAFCVRYISDARIVFGGGN